MKVELQLIQRSTCALMWGVVLSFSSCRESPNSDSHHGHHHEEGSTVFTKGKGLDLSLETMKSMGVTMVDVVDQQMVASRTAKAQVYRTGDEKPPADRRFKSGHAYASAFVPVQWLGELNTTDRVTVRGAGDSPVLIARLMGVDETSVAITQTAEALLEIPDPEVRLTLGTSISVEFHQRTPRKVTAIPWGAVLKTPEGAFAYVKNGSSMLRTRVEIGAKDDRYVEIKDGLMPGDVVAAQQVESLWLIELQATKGGGHCH